MNGLQTEQNQAVRIKAKYRPTDWQYKVFYDDHKFIVVVAGARSGKTIMALTKLVSKATEKWSSVNWYVAPTYGMAKFIAWDELKAMLEKFRQYDYIKKVNDSELYIKLLNNSTIQLKGADNPDSLRGVGLDFLVLDEYATMKKEVWNEVLRPRVIDRNGKVLFIGTPKGYNHFYELYQMELKEPDTWKSYHFRTIDNPYIPKHEIELARRDMDKRAFKQEFEASFETFGSQVFSIFERKQVKEIEFNNDYEFVLGMDFGWTAPTATLFIQVGQDENVYILDEIKSVQTPMRELAKQIRLKNYRRKSKWPDEKELIDPDWIGCDPSGDSRSEAVGTSSVAELRAQGFTVKYVKNYPGIIQDGISQIRKWFQNGKLFIDSKCTNLIKAFEMYRYPEPKNDIQSEIPLKDGISDHWIDSLRYFFLNRFPVKSAEWRAL